MTELVVLIALLGFGLAFLTYTSSISKFIKLAILPLFLFSTATGYSYFMDEVGKPAQRDLPETAEYVFHRITPEDTIIVWLREEGGFDRLYIIPYSREAAKELEEAKEKSEGGTGQNISTTRTKGASEGQSLETNDRLDLDSHIHSKG